MQPMISTSVTFNREQIRTIRFLVNERIAEVGYEPAFLVGILQVLDKAETAGTIANVRTSAEQRERDRIAKIYGPDLVDFVLRNQQG